MLGFKYFLALSFLISLPNAANSDEMADAASAARKALLKNFSEEELATLSDDQINQIIEKLPQARKIVRILCIANFLQIFCDSVCLTSPPPPPIKAVSALRRLEQYSGVISRMPDSVKVRFLERLDTIAK